MVLLHKAICKGLKSSNLSMVEAQDYFLEVKVCGIICKLLVVNLSS